MTETETIHRIARAMAEVAGDDYDALMALRAEMIKTSCETYTRASGLGELERVQRVEKHLREAKRLFAAIRAYEEAKG